MTFAIIFRSPPELSRGSPESGDGVISYRVRPPPQTDRPLLPLSVKPNQHFLGKAIIEPPFREWKVTSIECCRVLQIGHYCV